VTSALILVVGLVLVAAIVGTALVVAAKRSGQPDRDLAGAIRLLDRILAYDDAVTSLSPELRDEARRLVSSYYKELP
jgi:hypothetical protein